jgi:hypothetical protein
MSAERGMLGRFNWRSGLGAIVFVGAFSADPGFLVGSDFFGGAAGFLTGRALVELVVLRRAARGPSFLSGRFGAGASTV